MSIRKFNWVRKPSNKQHAIGVILNSATKSDVVIYDVQLNFFLIKIKHVKRTPSLRKIWKELDEIYQILGKHQIASINFIREMNEELLTEFGEISVQYTDLSTS